MVATQPEDIVNEALGELGVPEIGDIWDGAPGSVRAMRIYDTTMRELHAAAPWNFARRQRQLDLIGDASGIYTPNTQVPVPWPYIYEWPIDCVHLRFVLGLGATAIDESGQGIHPTMWIRPAPVPFVVGDYPRPNPYESSWDVSEGHSPESTRVIMTAELAAVVVYTGLIQYPDAWDPLFKRAMVTALAARLALSAVEDKRNAGQLRDAMKREAMESLNAARVRDGNEGWTVVDHTPDWIRFRNSGGYTCGGYGSMWSAMPGFEDAGGYY